MKKNILYMGLASLMLSLAACENGDQKFADYEGGTSVYFAEQYPVRTLILGYDEGGLNDMDNQPKWSTLQLSSFLAFYMKRGKVLIKIILKLLSIINNQPENIIQKLHPYFY